MTTARMTTFGSRLRNLRQEKGLSQKRLAGPMVRIPKRDAPVTKLRGCKGIPGHYLVGYVWRLQPGELVGKDKLPIEADDEEGEQKYSQWPIGSRVVVFGHQATDLAKGKV